jgi:hypothetical protein
MQQAANLLEIGQDTGVDEQLLRAHVAHIVSSRRFVGAPRLAKFLEFVIETVLAGHGDQIKESLIAVEVDGRRPDYNPQIDSTVRVEAGRLRARLRQYYEDSGRAQGIEIELPEGRYVPVFRERTYRIAAADTSCLEPLPEQVPQPNPELPSRRTGGRIVVIARRFR